MFAFGLPQFLCWWESKHTTSLDAASPWAVCLRSCFVVNRFASAFVLILTYLLQPGTASRQFFSSSCLADYPRLQLELKLAFPLWADGSGIWCTLASLLLHIRTICNPRSPSGSSLSLYSRMSCRTNLQSTWQISDEMNANVQHNNDPVIRSSLGKAGVVIANALSSPRRVGYFTCRWD